MSDSECMALKEPAAPGRRGAAVPCAPTSETATPPAFPLPQGEGRSRCLRASGEDERVGTLELDLYEGQWHISAIHDVVLDAGGSVVGIARGETAFRHG
jgi:hypothetical protein